MKILVVHNFHRTGSASGDDQVFKSETKLLEENGHEVIRYSVSNDDFDSVGIVGKIFATFGMLWSNKNYKSLKKIIKENNPDIVHIHTFFPLLSPAVLYAAKNSGKKVVATLHDTRFVCPCATSLRGNKICNLCGDGHYLRMAKYKCFKNSRLQSVIVAVIFSIHRFLKSFYKQIDSYICLNDNQIELLKDIGFNESKIVKKYNFVPDNEANTRVGKIDNMPERYVVFYGRIGEEKGIRQLMNIWNGINDIPLVVMGGGPCEEEFSQWAGGKSNVYYLGYVPHEKCLKIVKNSEFVIFPSIWYEGCSMVEIEAQSLGKPLIATNLGFSEEAIETDIDGIKVELNDVDGFKNAIHRLWNDPSLCNRMGIEARKKYLSRYLPSENYKQLIHIYRQLLN